MKPLVKPKTELVKCLGWCGKEFLSPDKTRIRFCKACASKKDQVERNATKIRTFGDGVSYSSD